MPQKGIEPQGLREYRLGLDKVNPTDKILKFIRAYYQENRVSPTYAEIAHGIGWKVNSRGSLKVYIDYLVKNGDLKRVRARSARALIPAY